MVTFQVSLLPTLFEKDFESCLNQVYLKSEKISSVFIIWSLTLVWLYYGIYLAYFSSFVSLKVEVVDVFSVKCPWPHL